MPIYEYQCVACGHRLDELQKIGEPPLTTCPSCQANALQKLVSATSFQLKGTGWYVTDFKNKNSAEGKESSNKTPAANTEAKTSSSESSLKETKTATTPPSGASEP